MLRRALVVLGFLSRDPVHGRRRLSLGIGIGCAAVVVALAVSLGSTGGTASASPAQGGQSRCGTITVAHAIYKVGQMMSASAKRKDTAGCGSSFAWGPAMPVGKVLSGCRPGNSSCVILATTPTQDGAAAWCISNGPGGAAWNSCVSYIVVDKGALIEGYARSPQGAPVGGLVVGASGAGGSTQAVTDQNGLYALSVDPGTYTIRPLRMMTPGRVSFSPDSTSRTVEANQVVRADFTVAEPSALSIALNPTSVPASGLATVGITITDTSAAGQPVVGAHIIVEPPVELGTHGIANAVLCNAADQLVSPERLNDGTLLGQHFTATTDGSGQVQFTLYVGTLAGVWTIGAYQPGADGAPRVSASLTVEPAGSGTGTLDDELVALLHSQPSPTLAKPGSEQRNVLEWLGQDILPQLPSVAYAPIHTVNATGQIESGVVLFANTPDVRSDVLRYLDGSTNFAPPETQAVVIDSSNTKWLTGILTASGAKATVIPWRLPSLLEWGMGGQIMIVLPGQTFSGEVVVVPEKAHGRPSFGLVDPVGHEDLLYGYGPYLPAPSTSPTAVALERCVGG